MGAFTNDNKELNDLALEPVKEVATTPVYREPPPLSINDLSNDVLPPIDQAQVNSTTFETWAPQWVQDAITFTGDSFSAAEIMSRAHNARSKEYLPTDEELQWAMEHAIAHEQDGYWKTSYAHVVPEFAGGLIGDFQSDVTTAGLKLAGSVAAGGAASILTGMAFETALAGALGFAIGGPAGAAIGAASIARRAYMISKITRVINGIFKASSATVVGGMAYSALDKAAYVPLEEKEARGIMEPDWSDVALSGLEVAKDLPLMLGSGFALGAIGKGFGKVFDKVTAKDIANNQDGIVMMQALIEKLDKELDIKGEERAGNFAHDPNEPLTAKYGLLDALGKDLYKIKEATDPVTGEVTYEFEGKPKTPFDKKGKPITSAEDLHAHLLEEHINRMAEYKTPKEMARYLASQMLDVGTVAETYKAMLHGALFKDMNIPENAILQFHELFGYSEELNNLVGDYVRELNNVISNVSTELTDKINKLNTGLTAEEFITKIGDNIKEVNKIFLNIAHELGIEAQPLEGWTPQNHDPHSINKAGFNKWSQDIYHALDEQKTFIDPHNKAVEERHAEIQEREAERAKEHQKRQKRLKAVEKLVEKIKQAYEKGAERAQKYNVDRLQNAYNKLSQISQKAVAKLEAARESMADIPKIVQYTEDVIRYATEQEKIAREAVDAIKKDIESEYQAKIKEIGEEKAKAFEEEYKQLQSTLDDINKSIKEITGKEREKQQRINKLEKQRASIINTLKKQYAKIRESLLSEEGKSKLKAYRESRNKLEKLKKQRASIMDKYKKAKKSIRKSIAKGKDITEKQKAKLAKFKDRLEIVNKLANTERKEGNALLKDIRSEYKSKAKEYEGKKREAFGEEEKKLKSDLEFTNKMIDEITGKDKQELAELKRLKKERAETKAKAQKAYAKSREKVIAGENKQKTRAYKEAVKLHQNAVKAKQEARMQLQKTKANLKIRAQKAIAEIKSKANVTEAQLGTEERIRIREAGKALTEFNKAVTKLDSMRDKFASKQTKRVFAATKRELKRDIEYAAKSAARVAKKIAGREKKGLYMRKWNDLMLWEQEVIKRDFLKSAYDNIALKDGQIDGAQVGSSARTFKQGRVLHFKNEQSFRDYSKSYGRKVNGSILSRYLDHIERYASNSALREKFGPTPGKAIDEMRNYILKNGGGEDIVSKTLLNLGQNWQNATMNGGSVFTDPKRASLSRGLFKVADDTLRAFRTKGSYVYSLIQEPIMAAIAKYTYMGKSIDGMFGAFKELATNGMNNGQLRYIGLLGDFITASRDMLDNDIQTFKDSKMMKAALKVRNAVRAMHLGTTISEHNREVTHLSAQFGFGEALSMDKLWHELPKQWRRLFRLAGLSEADFNIAKKYREILLTDGAQIPETKKYGDVKLMNWTQAIRNIDMLLEAGKITEASAKRLEIIARKFGKAQYKLVERVVAQGDKASSAFVDIAGYKSFWNRLMPYMSWSIREMANFVENGDWRIPEGAGSAKAIGIGLGQRLVIGSLITMVKLGEKGRMPHFYDDRKGIDFENLASFLSDVIYHGGVTQLFGQGTDNIFKSIMNEGSWRSPEDVAARAGRMLYGEVGAYTGEALMRIAHVLYAMSQNDMNKAKRQAFGFIPNAPDWLGLNLMAHRLMIDPIVSGLSPVYAEQLRKDAKRKRDSYAPYFLSS